MTDVATDAMHYNRLRNLGGSSNFGSAAAAIGSSSANNGARKAGGNASGKVLRQEVDYDFFL